MCYAHRDNCWHHVSIYNQVDQAFFSLDTSSNSKFTFARYRVTIFAQVSQYIRQRWAVNIFDMIIVNGPSAEMEGFSTPWNLKGLCIEMCLRETQITFCRFSRNMLSYDFQSGLNCGTRAHNFYCKSYQAISEKASSKFCPTFLDNQP